MATRVKSSGAGREQRARAGGAEARRHQRVKIDLPGRYMLEDRREFECRTLDMSPGGIALVAPVIPTIGERVVVYLDAIGRIDGVCVRDLGQGFAMNVKATPRRREKLAEQLTWFANQQVLGMEDLRNAGRIVPKQRQTTLTFENGTSLPARIVDLSRSGVALGADCIPAIGAAVRVGQVDGHVVRILDEGIAVHFEQPIPIQRFDEDIEL
ncbi:MAG TPA: PilZ domain-containing protein [Beijerinckiaceae bacterium]|jgi:hypothetical protein|nr:PilZ domain-containing protein [Beijerinckiaceae bacterium]